VEVVVPFFDTHLDANSKPHYDIKNISKRVPTMKRKLDQNDEPSPSKAAKAAEATEVEVAKELVTTTEKQKPAELSFAELGLDPRLVQAVAKQGFEKPTLVQRKAIPLALDGQDVLCKAKTGSGKTAAYVLPALSAILKRKAVCLILMWDLGCRLRD